MWSVSCDGDDDCLTWDLMHPAPGWAGSRARVEYLGAHRSNVTVILACAGGRVKVVDKRSNDAGRAQCEGQQKRASSDARGPMHPDTLALAAIRYRNTTTPSTRPVDRVWPLACLPLRLRLHLQN